MDSLSPSSNGSSLASIDLSANGIIAINNDSIFKDKKRKFKINDKFRDKLLTGFESHFIVRSYIEFDKQAIYYCSFCGSYLQSREAVEQHCQLQQHLKARTDGFTFSKDLNKRFSMKPLKETSVSINDFALELKHKALDSIPVEVKHYYLKKGIKLDEGIGANAYFCRFCQKSIPSFDAIESHIRSDNHSKVEENPTKFKDRLLFTTEPIVGLKYIREFMNDNEEPVYECTLCICSENSRKMLKHMNQINHRINLLKMIVPNNDVLKLTKDELNSKKSLNLIRDEIQKLEEEFGCGYLNRIYTKKQNSTQISNESKEKDQLNKDNEFNFKDIINTNMTFMGNPMASESMAKPFVGQQLSEKSHEVIDLKIFSKLFAVKLFNENDASQVVEIIGNIKDSVISYYSKDSLKTNPLNQRINDNYNTCEMDLSP